MRIRWVYSETDERAPVLDKDNSTAALGWVVTVCQQPLPDTTPIYQRAPGMTICPRCEVSAAVPPPEHPTCPERFP